MKKTCQICGDEFVSSRSSAAYCSDCRAAYKNPEREAKKMRAAILRSTRAYREPEMRSCTCAECGSSFSAPASVIRKVSRGGARFCSKRCMMTYVTSHAVCRLCEAPLPKSAGVTDDPRTHFCSEEHRAEFYLQKAREEHRTCTCLECGKEFAKRGGSQLYCSRSCYEAAVRSGAEAARLKKAEAKRRAALKPAPTIKRNEVCPICGAHFVGEYKSASSIGPGFHGCCPEHEAERIERYGNGEPEVFSQRWYEWYGDLGGYPHTISDIAPQPWKRPRNAEPTLR